MDTSISLCTLAFEFAEFPAKLVSGSESALNRFHWLTENYDGFSSSDSELLVAGVKSNGTVLLALRTDVSVALKGHGTSLRPRAF